jgi:hypothetical protein
MGTTKTGLLAALMAGLTPETRLSLRRRLNRLRRPAWLGTLRRTTPVSSNWGLDRGVPMDRYYIARFLDEHRADIRGRVLEVKDDGYSARYGTGVERCEVLDIDPTNTRASIVADLAGDDLSPWSASFDCFVLTQTLQFIYDIRSAIAGARGLLRSGGVVLSTIPAVSRLAPRHEPVTDYWRLTAASATALFEESFGAGQVQVRTYGNVLSAVAFLMGMASDELSQRELDINDLDLPVLVTVRAVRR